MSSLEGASILNLSVCARLYGIHGNDGTNQLITNELKKVQSIMNLPRAPADRKDYETKLKCGPCFKGTREALLREMMDWVTEPGESKMYTLSGLAGTGKSTIAYTVATQADERGLLGASYFFSRHEADRKSAKNFFTTIAYQLCLFNEQFARAISEVLVTEHGSAAITGSPQEQLHDLILDPLRTVILPDTPRMLIVVDALNECDREDIPFVLMGLRQLVQAFPPFRIILTTRPHLLLKYDFGAGGSHRIFNLKDIEDNVVNDDIRLYLKHNLSQEQVRAQLQDPAIQWCASDAQVESLVQAAGRFFIISSLSVRYILDQHWSAPAARIQTLLEGFAQGRTPFKNLSLIYTTILNGAIPAGCNDKNLVERYQVIIGTIVLCQDPLSVDALANLIGIEAETIFAILCQLQPVILISADNIPVIYHTSFVDYITGSGHCKDVKLRIDPGICHTSIAIRCFEMMDKHSKYNILGLGTPARFMTNTNGLAKEGISDEKLREMIPPVLRYACVYWASHFNGANIDDADLMRQLQWFANTHALHWFEVSSLIKKLDSAHRAICDIIKLLKPPSSNLRQLFSDGLRFISRFCETIKQSALHTYYSALPFMPTDSLLYRRYIQEASHNVFDVHGVWKRWDALMANLKHEDWVGGVQFSFDGTKLASWSEERNGIKKVLRVWDATTGSPVSTIKGDGFAIANDFSTVASFKGNSLTLYNMDNGSGRDATLQAQILKVALSSESTRFAAILSGGMVCLGDSVNGQLVGSYEDDPDQLGCLQFSATGARFAYMTSDHVIKLRSGIDGRLIANLDCGSQYFHRCVAFSRDGSHIASSDVLSGLRLWRCTNGNLVGFAKDAYPYILAVSTNGSILATGGSRNVKLWNGNVDNLPLIENLDLVDRDPGSIAFSPDDTMLAITTGMHAVKLYNITHRSYICTLSFIGTSGVPVAFSTDCSLFAVGTWTGTVYLWDIRGIEVSSHSNEQANNSEINKFILSPDCSRLACGFKDGTVELWKTDGFAKQRIVTHKYHPTQVVTIGFGPDGRLSASGSLDGTIQLWDGEDGLPRGALRYPRELGSLSAVAISNRVLAAAGERGIVLWDRKMLNHIHTFEGFFVWPLSFSANGALLAAIFRELNSDKIFVFDVTERTTIATFDVDYPALVEKMTFLPDNTHLVCQHLLGFLTVNLVDKKVTQETTLEHLIQVPNMPLWHGVPVWTSIANDQVMALFSPHDDPIPVLWIPKELRAWTCADGRSLIALRCGDGRIILLRLRS